MCELQFFFSPGSRYSYLALTQLPRIEAEHAVSFEWIPTVGARLRELRGADPFSGPPLSGQYEWTYRRKDAEAWADFYGVPFAEPESVVFDARLLSLAVIAADRLGFGREYAVELASEVFARKSWPIDRDLCQRVASTLGLDGRAFASLVDSDETSQQLETNCQRAVGAGVFGNPTFRVGDAMHWGQDRLPLVQHALRKRATKSA